MKKRYFLFINKEERRAFDFFRDEEYFMEFESRCFSAKSTRELHFILKERKSFKYLTIVDRMKMFDSKFVKEIYD
jgi:hypothetical protein